MSFWSDAKYANSIAHPDLETLDPNPDIFLLFKRFDDKYFGSTLGRVYLVWSTRMTLCAGVCRYRGAHGGCSIHLSRPLLSLRSRKDLVETLLHEMIHAYLFLTENNRERQDHGPKFIAHMNRINGQAGVNISIYHSFHNEVEFYKTHWWRCNGPCLERPPYFGYVKRSMNRAPGPNDGWWASHKATCCGSFIKLKEPIKNSQRKVARSPDVSIGAGQKRIDQFFPKGPGRDDKVLKPTGTDGGNRLGGASFSDGSGSKVPAFGRGGLEHPLVKRRKDQEAESNVWHPEWKDDGAGRCGHPIHGTSMDGRHKTVFVTTCPACGLLDVKDLEVHLMVCTALQEEEDPPVKRRNGSTQDVKSDNRHPERKDDGAGHRDHSSLGTSMDGRHKTVFVTTCPACGLLDVKDLEVHLMVCTALQEEEDPPVKRQKGSTQGVKSDDRHPEGKDDGAGAGHCDHSSLGTSIDFRRKTIFVTTCPACGLLNVNDLEVHLMVCTALQEEDCFVIND